jgi:23S rRNA (adenine1618-N6)-methyltransferase
MSKAKNVEKKSRLHPRNKNRDRYDLGELVNFLPELTNHIKPNKYGDDSVDFADPMVVKLLNKALLKHGYGIDYWEFPEENLCPPIPGRADYIHYMADLIQASNYGKIPDGPKITCLDIGVGASCIYPIIGTTEYGWDFIGTDIAQKSLDAAVNIIQNNPKLVDKIKVRLQQKPADIFHGVLAKEEKVDLTICNPPFHASISEAESGTRRKVKNLSGEKSAALNFSGQHNELVYDGGEHGFIHKMIRESVHFSQKSYWFSTLVSKQSNLKGIHIALEKAQASKIETIPMGTGNKSTRIVAWTFLTKEERKNWAKDRWA